MEKQIVNNPQTLNGLKVVNDPEEALKYILEGETVCRFEYGDSMTPVLNHGQYARLTPLSKNPKQGDAVFCRVNDCLMTHMVFIVNEATGQCLICSTAGTVFGWTDEVYAIATPMPFYEPHCFLQDDIQ